MSSWHSYPKIYSFGHAESRELLSGPVNVEEKVDGSQFSFGMIEDPELASFDVDGPTHFLRVRSKGAVMHPDAPEKMFKLGVEFVKGISHLLHPGWTYRGEFLAKPKHNALAYERVPKGHVILFDINSGEEEFLSYEKKKAEAERIGLEVVPRLFSGRVEKIEDFRAFLEETSILGGQKIEGVVIKPLNYDLFGRDKKVIFGKFVSEAYKEVHSLSWKENNPAPKDIIGAIGTAYCSAARWSKAVQHLKERGMLTDSPKDIGPLIQEVASDVNEECSGEIKEKLFAYAWPTIKRALTNGLPQWYKEKLLSLAFEGVDQDPVSPADESNSMQPQELGANNSNRLV